MATIPNELLPADLQGAGTLVKIDKAIQKFTGGLDKVIEKVLAKIPDRVPVEPDTECNETQSVIRTDLALRAVRFGLLRVVFRALPGMLEAFVEQEIGGFLTKVISRVVGKRILGGVGGQILGGVVVALASTEYMLQLERGIIREMGCDDSSDGEARYLGARAALNALVTDQKQRNAQEPRRLGPVRTRHNDTDPIS